MFSNIVCTQCAPASSILSIRMNDRRIWIWICFRMNIYAAVAPCAHHQQSHIWPSSIDKIFRASNRCFFDQSHGAIESWISSFDNSPIKILINKKSAWWRNCTVSINGLACSSGSTQNNYEKGKQCRWADALWTVDNAKKAYMISGRTKIPFSKRNSFEWTTQEWFYCWNFVRGLRLLNIQRATSFDDKRK